MTLSSELYNNLKADRFGAWAELLGDSKLMELCERAAQVSSDYARAHVIGHLDKWGVDWLKVDEDNVGALLR